MRWFGTLAARFERRSTAVDLIIVLLVAALIRLAFLFRAPPFYVGGDSPTYLQPALDLLRGAGFDPIVKRPPGYPLFVALSLWFHGLDLQGLVFAQHLLGTLTAGLTWALGRAVFGRLAGLLAGLLVALNGTLVIFEQYVMAETLFTALLTLALLLLVQSARSPSRPRLVAMGLVLGLASATRQSALPLLLLIPLGLLLGGHRGPAMLTGTGLAALGFAILALPWIGFDLVRHQTVSSGTLGETLTWRLTRSSPDNEMFRWRLSPSTDPLEQEARKFAFGQAADRVLPSDTKVALQQRFGLDEASADRVMRGLALEAIGQQPVRYVSSSLEILLEHLLGQEQFLGGQGKSGGVKRYADVETKYGDWWSEQTRPLIQNANPAQENEFRRAQALTSLYQPYRFGWPLLVLTLVGLVWAGLKASRPGLLVGLAALLLLLLAAFLAGSLPRYRYPVDPALAVLQAGGLLCFLALARRALVWRPIRAPARREDGGGLVVG